MTSSKKVCSHLMSKCLCPSTCPLRYNIVYQCWCLRWREKWKARLHGTANNPFIKNVIDASAIAPRERTLKPVAPFNTPSPLTQCSTYKEKKQYHFFPANQQWADTYEPSMTSVWIDAIGTFWQVSRRNLHDIVWIVDGHVYVDVTCEQGFALQPLWNDISFWNRALRKIFIK